MSHKICDCKPCKISREEPKIKIIKIPKGYNWIQSEKKGDRIAIIFKRRI